MDLSVIIPVYNHEEYIEQCMSTILEDFPENSEIIIIDDVCTDSTIKKIENLNSDRIKIYRNKTNMGCAYNLNKGIELAQGKYIGINYSDDFVEKGFYKKLLEVAKEKNADVVCANIADYNEDEKQTVYNDITAGNIFYEEYKNNINLMEIPFQVDAGFLLGHWTASSASTKIIKKEFYEKYKFYGSKANDIPAIYPIMGASKKIIYYPKLYLFYREVQNSLSRASDEKSYNSVIESILKAFKLLDEINANEEKEILFFNNCLDYLFLVLAKIGDETLCINCIKYFYDRMKEYDKDVFEKMKKSKYYDKYFIIKNIDKTIYQCLMNGNILTFIEKTKLMYMQEKEKKLDDVMIQMEKERDNLQEEKKQLNDTIINIEKEKKQLNDTIVNIEKEKKQLNDTITNIEKEKKKLLKINEEINSNNNDLRTENNELKAKVKQLNIETEETIIKNEELQGKIEHIINNYENSKSWKITKPLREINKLVKKK